MAKKRLTLTDQLRKALYDCGESRYRVSAETGIAQAVLHKFFHGGGMSLENIDTLTEYLGLELRPKRPKRKGR